MIKAIDDAVDYVRSRSRLQPQAGVVLGSGLGNVVDAIDVDTEIPYADIPAGKAATVWGHSGKMILGRAGKLLTQMIEGTAKKEGIPLVRQDIYICNVVKCRPPGNRDPQPNEIDSCQRYLNLQVELIEPKLICTLGNFSTKLLRADPAGITRVHGQTELRTFGRRTVRLYPIFHPAAALYTPRMLEILREDFARLPALLALEVPEQPAEAGSPAPAGSPVR